MGEISVAHICNDGRRRRIRKREWLAYRRNDTSLKYQRYFGFAIYHIRSHLHSIDFSVVHIICSQTHTLTHSIHVSMYYTFAQWPALAHNNNATVRACEYMLVYDRTKYWLLVRCVVNTLHCPNCAPDGRCNITFPPSVVKNYLFCSNIYGGRGRAERAGIVYIVRRVW